MKLSQVVGIVAGILAVIATIFGWGFYLGNRLTKIDNRVGYVENFLKQHYRTFVTTNVEAFDRQISPVIQASEGTKAAVGTLVNLDPEKNSFVIYDPKTDATDVFLLTPDVEAFVYVPALKRVRRISTSALRLGDAVAAVKTKGGDRVDKIYTSPWEPTPEYWGGWTLPPSLEYQESSAQPSPSRTP